MVGSEKFSCTEARCHQLYSEGRYKEAEQVCSQLLEEGAVEGEELALVYNNRGHARYGRGGSRRTLLPGTCRWSSGGPSRTWSRPCT